MAMHLANVYRFGPYEAELDSGQLRKQGLSIKLQDQPFQILALLLERAGGVVTREEIKQRLWPENTFVEFDNGLNVAVTKLRAALNDDADAPRYIETIPKRGYRFIAEVVPPSPVVSSAPAETVKSSAPEIISAQPSQDAITEVRAKGRWLWPWAVAGTLVIVVAVGWAVRPKHAEGSLETPTSTPVVSPVSTPVRRSVAVLSFRNASGREDAAWISTAVSEMLSTELAVDNRLRLVSGEEIAQIRLTAPWTSSDSLKSETTARLGTALNSDYLVTGTYAVVGKGGNQKLRLDARLQEAGTGRILAEIAETGTESDLFPLVQHIGDHLRPLLG